jgi:thermitase
MQRLSALLLLIFSIFCLSAIPRTAYADTFVSGQVIITLKPTVDKAAVEILLRSNRAHISAEIPQLHSFVLTVPQAAETAIVRALSKNPLIESAELNYTAQAFSTPNDPFYQNNQWGFANTGQIIVGQTGVVDADIDMDEAWDITSGSAQVNIAILDTGIDQDHEDLFGKIVDNKNFTDSVTVDDLYGHGTHVAGVAAASANNAIGVAGGCSSCMLMNIKVLNDNGSGAYSWIANGITYAADNGAKVINLSLGGSVKSRVLENAVNYAWNKGVIVVAAAGNSANISKTYPAAYARVIAVAATDNNDKKASFSSHGYRWVDVAAPGVNIYSTFPNHTYTINKSLGYDFASGTSMATPMTAATAALIWSTSYGTSASSVRSRLESTADKISGTGKFWSKGRINAQRAVTP